MTQNYYTLDDDELYAGIINRVSWPGNTIICQYHRNGKYSFHKITVNDYLLNQAEFISSIHIVGFNGFWCFLCRISNHCVFIHEDLGVRISMPVDNIIYVHSVERSTFLLDNYSCGPSQKNCQWVTYIGTDSSGLYKIGKTTNTLRRQSSINTGNPYFNIILTLSRDVEYELHKLYGHKRKSGEWFSLSADDILDIIKKFGFVKI